MDLEAAHSRKSTGRGPDFGITNFLMTMQIRILSVFHMKRSEPVFMLPAPFAAV